MSPTVPHLVVVDDEPLMAASVTAHLDRPDRGRGRGRGPVIVHGVDRPRRLTELPLDRLTHAVVDLSFGRDDLDGPHLQPEIETGVDAIDLLVERCPSCQVVVATRNDTDLITEMVVAIRQTWPQVVFFHKADARLRHRIEDFVDGRHYQDNAEIALDLVGVGPVPPQRITEAVEATARPRPGARLVLTLADMAVPPTRQEVADALGGRAEAYVRSLAADLTAVLLEWDLLERHQGGGVTRLWHWSRARRAILRRALAPLLSAS